MNSDQSLLSDLNVSTKEHTEKIKKFTGGVNGRKDGLLKTRLQTLIHSQGLSEPEFFGKVGISRQYWYLLSWGISECPIEIKVKIARLLQTDSSAIFFKSGSEE